MNNNSSNQPILTIGLPTYNRADFFAECLESVKKAIAESGFEDQIEVVISDNGSPDHTQEVVQRFRPQFKNLRDFRHPKNLEFDTNVLTVLRQARGQWCWLICDDEVIEPWSLNFLNTAFKEAGDIPYICVNHGAIPQTKEIEKYNSGTEWLKRFGLAGGLLSQSIFKVSALPSDMEKYIGNFWIHFSIAHEIIGNGGGMLVKKLLAEPEIPRLTRFSRAGQTFYNYTSLYKVIKIFPNIGYDQKTVDGVLKDMASGLPHVIASARLQGLGVSRKNLEIIWEEYKGYLVWRILASIILLTPEFILKLIKFVSKKYAATN